MPWCFFALLRWSLAHLGHGSLILGLPQSSLWWSETIGREVQQPPGPPKSIVFLATSTLAVFLLRSPLVPLERLPFPVLFAGERDCVIFSIASLCQKEPRVGPNSNLFLFSPGSSYLLYSLPFFCPSPYLQVNGRKNFSIRNEHAQPRNLRQKKMYGGGGVVGSQP